MEFAVESWDEERVCIGGMMTFFEQTGLFAKFDISVVYWGSWGVCHGITAVLLLLEVVDVFFEGVVAVMRMCVYVLQSRTQKVKSKREQHTQCTRPTSPKLH